jgi:hypothetical protein
MWKVISGLLLLIVPALAQTTGINASAVRENLFLLRIMDPPVNEVQDVTDNCIAFLARMAC